MTFWSGKTLRARLPQLIHPYVAERIDCASYVLTIGKEIYISPSAASVDAKTTSKRTLNSHEGFAIPPGQFAFLLTEEIVNVPPNALALISIRARVKFRGLVNVSGFHVDPGYSGQLVFAVFNAGPTPIHLEQGQGCFLIWYASLDCESTDIKHSKTPNLGLPSELISGIAGELQSFEGLSSKIKDVEKKLTDSAIATEKSLNERVHAIEREHTTLRTYATVAVTLLGSLTVASARGCWSEAPKPARPAVEQLAPAYAPGATPSQTPRINPTPSAKGSTAPTPAPTGANRAPTTP